MLSDDSRSRHDSHNNGWEPLTGPRTVNAVMALFRHLGLSTLARVHAAAWIILLSVADAAPVWAEAGERFAPEPPAPPLLVAEDPPAAGILHEVRDPPRLESARGSARRDALAKRPERRAVAPASVEGVIGRPNRAAPPVQEQVESVGVGLIHRAAAAELGSVAAAPVASWRRVLGSPYVAWIALIVLVGVPIFGLLRGEIAGRRAERELVNSD